MVAARSAPTEISITVFLDREAGLSTDLIVKCNTTIKDVKEQLAASDPTGSTKADQVGVGLPPRAPGQTVAPLPDEVPITEFFFAGQHVELDICQLANAALEEEDEEEAGGLSVLESLKQDAQDAVEDGDLDVAIEKYTEAIALSSSVQLYTKRAQVFLQLDQHEEAIKDCTKALSIDPDSAKAFKIRARAHAQLEHWAQAHADFQELLKISSDEDVEAEAGEVAARIKALEAAAKEARAQIWEVIGNADSKADGVFVRSGLGPFSSVESARLSNGAVIREMDLEGDNLNYKKLSGEGPDEGWICIVLNNKPMACRVYLPKATDEEPEGEPLFPPKSPAHIDEISEETQRRQRVLKEWAAEALEDEDPDLAQKLMTEAIALGCASTLMYSKRAEILLQVDRPRAAIADCSAALSANPNSGKALKVRARAHAKTRQWAEAHADFQACLRLDYDDDTFEESVKVAAKVAQLWEIIGGADSGGVLVQAESALTSSQFSTRLACGAVVVQVDLVGDRLHYHRVTGGGPKDGWITIVNGDEVLACRARAEDVLATGAEPKAEDQAEDHEPPAPDLSPADVLQLTGPAQDRQESLKQSAAEALADGNTELALERMSEAIALGCATAIMYSKRAQALLDLGRPRAAVSDCTAALCINPNSGRALGVRARAHARLKHWVQAHLDFQESLRIDFDDATYEEAMKVAARAKEIQAVTTGKRLQLEQVETDKMLARAEAEKEKAEMERLNLEKLAAIQRVDEETKAQENIARVMNDPQMRQYYQQAKQKGWMTDFMGTKRGKCKCCSRCDVYVWRPVKLSSCAAANVPIACALCGCPPDKHVDRGKATQDDLV